MSAPPILPTVGTPPATQLLVDGILSNIHQIADPPREMAEFLQTQPHQLYREDPAQTIRLLNGITSFITATRTPPDPLTVLPAINLILRESHQAAMAQPDPGTAAQSLAALKAGLQLASACAAIAATRAPAQAHLYLEALVAPLPSIAARYHPATLDPHTQIFDQVLTYIERTPALAAMPAAFHMVHNILTNRSLTPTSEAVDRCLDYLILTQSHPDPGHPDRSIQNQSLALSKLRNPQAATHHARALNLAVASHVQPDALSHTITHCGAAVAEVALRYVLTQAVNTRVPVSPRLQDAADTRTLDRTAPPTLQAALTLLAYASPTRVPQLLQRAQTAAAPDAVAIVRAVAQAMALSTDATPTNHFSALIATLIKTTALSDHDGATAQHTITLDPETSATVLTIARRSRIDIDSIANLLEQSSNHQPTPRTQLANTSPPASRPPTGRSH